MNRHTALRVLATFAFAGTVLVNAMANLLPINALTTREVSALYPNLFTPAGITFSIWSVIYFLLLGFIIFCWIHREDERISHLLPWFVVTAGLNVSWVLVWHYRLPNVSVLLMVALLYTLTKLFLYIQHHLPKKKSIQFLVALPFTLYLAWICVATTANVSAVLVSWNWNGWLFSPQQWTVAMMVTITVLSCKVMVSYRTYAFGAVVIWALMGIFLRWRNSDYTWIIYSAIILSVLIATSMVLISRKKSRL